MGFLRDNLIPIFKKSELVFKESHRLAENVYTFVFEKANDLTWNAGQYGLFSITHKKIKNATKPFSLSSAPAEKDINITTVIRGEPSEFKQALLELKPGMKVRMSGPLGPFYVKDKSPTLLIAGGIGITPFRSILKQLEAEGAGAGKPFQLLYMDSRHSYLFRDELDSIAEKSSLQVAYLDSREKLYAGIDKFAAQHKDNGKFFVAGPKSMAEEVSAYLKGKNIAKRNISKDVFFGY